MKLTCNTLNIFNKNLQKTAEDKLTDRTPDKVALIKLYSAHFTDTLRAMHNGTKEEQLEADAYIKSRAFNKDCKQYGIEPITMLRMLIYINNDIIDVDDIESCIGLSVDCDDIPELLED